MKDTINLKEILRMVKKDFWMIGIVAIVIGVISAIYSFYFITPVYQASTQIIVNQGDLKPEDDFYNVRTDLDYINTYNDLIASPLVLDKVIEELKLSQTSEELAKDITIINKEDSQVITIYAQGEDHVQLVDLVNTIAAVFQEEIGSVMSVDNVQVISPAVTESDASPIKPQPVVNISVALIIGLVLGFGISFIRLVLNNKITSEKEIEENLSIPVIGTLSAITKRELNSFSNHIEEPELVELKPAEKEGLGGKAVDL